MGAVFSRANESRDFSQAVFACRLLDEKKTQEQSRSDAGVALETMSVHPNYGCIEVIMVYGKVDLRSMLADLAAEECSHA